MSVDELPILGITMGDAAGVGPEVTVKALMNDAIRAKARVVVLGDASVMEDAARIVGCTLPVRAIDEIRPDELDDQAIWVLDFKNRPLAGLTRGKIVADKASFDDRVPIELRIVEGYNRQSVIDVKLCAYDRRARRAAITDGAGRLGVNRR